ncbi:60S ribosomal protein L18-like [Cricetulus griseus]|uniref:60S ribosomal protein L18-like n=1 Tax=Cricetulus griseus TaxID=10029 RepID=A0A9J7GWU7_CRIGR|nr:60S ribosomal protein L18-like [Cricetulus griseus]XP_035311838.1 60S ribosomal protein L18-like [Cricetulus griseus]
MWGLRRSHGHHEERDTKEAVNKAEARTLRRYSLCSQISLQKPRKKEVAESGGDFRSGLQNGVLELLIPIQNSSEQGSQSHPEGWGKILTFDQLALESPKGRGTVLLSGPRKGRKVYWHFGKAPGTPHSHTKPYVYSKGWKLEVRTCQRQKGRPWL